MASIPKHGIPTARLKLEYPQEGDVPLIVLTDLHIGSKHHDRALLDRILKYADEHDAYFWLNGDILENAIKHSVGDINECDMTPNEQLEEMREIFGPRRHRVLAVLSGNHEGRTKRESDFDPIEYWANEEPRIPYLNRAGAVALTVKGQKWVVYGMHGVRGCGRKPGSAKNAVYDMHEVVDADLYVHGHHHKEDFFKDKQLQHKDPIGFFWRYRWYCNGGTLHKYGGYGADAGYPANDVGAYCLWLNDATKGAKTGKHIRAEFLDRGFFGMSR